MNVLYICRSLKYWGNRDSSLDCLAEPVLAGPDAYLLLQLMNTLRFIKHFAVNNPIRSTVINV